MNHPLITAGGRYPFQKKERKRNNGFTVPEKIAIIYLNPGRPKWILFRRAATANNQKSCEDNRHEETDV